MITEVLDKFLAGLQKHVETGQITWPLIVVVVVLVAPTLWGIYTRYFLLRRIETGLQARIADKESELIRVIEIHSLELARFRQDKADEIARLQDSADSQILRLEKRVIQLEKKLKPAPGDL